MTDTSAGAPTLSQVAARAGVSLATASRVLNGSSRRVSEELRARVMACADELRYSPHGPAQAMARGTSQFVSLVVGDIADPYFSSIAAGVTREAERRGMTVAIAPTGGDPAREAAVVTALRSQRPRALVVASSRTSGGAAEASVTEGMLRAAELGASVAYLGGESNPPPVHPLRLLRLGNRSGAAALADALVERGYRSFAVLAGPEALVTARERADAFSAAVVARGLVEPVRVAGALSRAGGGQAVSALLDAGVPVQCVFAVADLMAVGAMAALRERGLRPGTDVAVAGFDDVQLLQDVRPALTTVALPLVVVGERLLRLALDGEGDGQGDGASAGVVAGVVQLRESTPALP